MSSIIWTTPLNGDFRKKGGLNYLDSDVAGIEYDASGNLIGSVSVNEAPYGVEGFHKFTTAPDGSNSLRLYCPPCAVGSSSGTRAEFRYSLLSIPEFPTTVNSFYKVKIWLGKEWLTTKPVSVAQMHRGSGATPPTAWLFWLLWVNNGYFELSIPNYELSPSDYVNVSRAPILVDSWIEIGIEMRFAKGKSGEVRLWVNGVGYNAVRGIRTAYDSAPNGPYPKVGIYNILRHTDVDYTMFVKDVEFYFDTPVSDKELNINRKISIPTIP